MPPVMHTLLTEKHPVARLIPAPKVEVAEPVTSRRSNVVEPVVLFRAKMAGVVVANVVGEDVEIYRVLATVRKLNGAPVAEPSESVNWGAVELAS